MPFVPESQYNSSGPLRSYAQPPKDPFAPGPSMGDVVGAAWRDGVPYAAYQAAKGILGFLSATPGAGVDPSFDLKSFIGGTKYESQYLDDFIGTPNETAMRATMAKIDTRERDNQTLSDAGFAGKVVQVGLGFLDPTNYIPFVDVVSGAAKGMTAARIALRAGALGAAQSTTGEALLQATQPGRERQESAGNIASATILSGLLGAGIGFLSKGEYDGLVKNMDTMREEATAHIAGSPLPQPAGAAASDVRQLEQHAYLPWPLQKVNDMLSPLGRIFSSSSVQARRTVADLAETVRTFKDNDIGVTTTLDGLPPIDRTVRMAITSKLYAADEALKNAYIDYRYGANAPLAPMFRARVGSAPDGMLSPKEFSAAVFEALYSGDKHAIPQVQQTAQLLRKEIYEPIKALAQNTKDLNGRPLLGDVNAPTGDESFANRVWLKPKIAGGRNKFVGTVTDWLKGEQAKKAGIQARLAGWQAHADEIDAAILKKQGAIETLERQVAEAGQKAEEATALNRFANRRAEDMREGGGNLDNARGGAVFETRVRNRGNELQDRLSGKSAELDRLYDELDALHETRNSARKQIEGELARWEGKSTAEVKAALKARAKAEAERDAAREAGTYKGKGERLTSADDAVERAVRRILASDRNLSEQELRARADQITDRILSTPDGRLPYDDASPDGGAGMGGAEVRGSLNEREFAIPTALVKEFVSHDTTEVLHTYMRTVLPDILLTQRFGDTRMTSALRKITEEYAARASRLTSEKALRKLEAEKQGVIRDLTAIRDRVRGTYGYSSDPGVRRLASISRALRHIGIGTDMGSSVINSLGDATTALFRFSLGHMFKSAWAPFFKGLATRSEFGARNLRQARAMGIALETHHAMNGNRLGDAIDYYKAGSGVEKLTGWMADKTMVLNLMAPWTDLAQRMASSAACDEILYMSKRVVDGKASKADIRALAAGGISPDKAARIWKAHADSGVEPVDGALLPDTGKWADEGARASFEGAVTRDVDAAVIKPGQETPLFLSRPTGALLGQYMSFVSAANERLLVAGLQRRDARTLSGLIATVGAGMLSYKLYSAVTGQPTSDRPQDWIKEGVSRSGVTGWFSEINARQAKFFAGKTDAFRLIGADRELSRFQQRSALAGFLGPTYSRLEKLQGPLYSLSQGTWTANDTDAIRRWAWLQNHFAVRGLLDKMEGKAP